MGQRIGEVLSYAVGVVAVHKSAVMTVLFLVFGVDLIAKDIPPLT